MNTKQTGKPRWSRLYGVLVLSVGLLLLEHKLHLTSTGHRIALLIAVVVIYTLLGLWIKYLSVN